MTERISDQLAELTPEQRQLLAMRLRKAAHGNGAGPSAEHQRQPLSLSFTQEQLWFLDRLEPGNPAYDVPFALRLAGTLDHAALHDAVNAVVARHDALRTVFAQDGGEVRQVVRPGLRVPLPVDDLRDRPEDQRQALLRQVVAEHARHRFDLTAGPLLAVRLVALADDHHLLLVTAHHIVFDAASAEIFARDLTASYGELAAGERARLSALTTGFADHAAKQRRRLDGALLDAHLAYWREQLAGAPPLSTVPPDRPRPAVRTYRGGQREIVLPTALTSALAELSRREGVTLNAVVLTAFAALLRRATGQEQVLIGMPVAGRPTTDLEPLIGCFANMLVLPLGVPGVDTVRELVRATHRAISAAHAHQDAPYARVVAEVRPPRDTGFNPLFQVMVSLTEGAEVQRGAAGVTFTLQQVDGGFTDFDLLVTLSRRDGELVGTLGYNADLYLDDTAEEIVTGLRAALADMAAHPERPVGQLPALRRQRLTVASSFTAEPVLAPLRLWLDLLRLPMDVELAPYQQVVQHLLAGGDHAVTVLLRWEDWLRHADVTGAMAGDLLEGAMRDLEAAVRSYRRRCATPLVVAVCPASPRYTGPSWSSLLGRLDDRLALLATKVAEVHPVWLEDWAGRQAVTRTHDEQADRLGHVPYTDEFFAMLGTVVARRVERVMSQSLSPDDRAGVPVGRLGPERAAYLAEHLATPAAVLERIRPAWRPALPGGQPAVAPRTETERRLAALWRQALRLESVGVTDDFFALGGHSLLATGLLSRVHAELGREVSLYTFFTHPTIERLAEVLEQAEPETSAATPPLHTVARDGELMPSSTQRRLWALAQLGDDPARHNTTFAAVLRGALDEDALRRAVAEVVRRHEILRTRFAEKDGRPVMVIAEQADCWLPTVDLTEEAAEERAIAVRQDLRRHTRHVYDLAAGPLLRVRLLRTAPGEHHLLLGMHHIVCDNTSWGVFLSELGTLYGAFRAGDRSPLPPLPAQFADYADWQRRLLADDGLQSHLAWWREQLAGAPPVLELSTDRPRPAVASGRAARARRTPPGEAGRALRQLARDEGVSAFAALLAVFAVLLHRRSGHDDIVVGVPSAGRGRPELERLIGCFTDLLPLRLDLSGRPSFRQLVRRVHRTVVEAYQHADVPFATIVEALRVPRDQARHPLFQCALNVADLPEQALDWPGLEVTPQDTPATGVDFDLFLNLSWQGDALEAVLDYRADLFAKDSGEGLLAELAALIDELVSQPEDTIGPSADTATSPDRPSPDARTVRVAASFPAEPVARTVRFWSDLLEFGLSVELAPPGSLLRCLLDPPANPPRAADELRVALLRWEDRLPPNDGDGACPLARGVLRLEQYLDGLCQMIAAFRARSDVPLLLCVFPPSRHYRSQPWAGVLGQLTDRLCRVAARFPAVSVVPVERWARRWAVDESHMADDGELPYGGELPAAVGTEIAHAAPGFESVPRELLTEVTAELADAAAIQTAVARGYRQGGQRPAGAPRSERERTLAALWAELLGVDRVGIHDDFFALGGDSMTAIQAVARANQAGIVLTPRQLVAHRTIAALSEAGEQVPTIHAEQDVLKGDAPLTAAQQWFFDTLAPRMANPAHFNHPYYLEVSRPIDPAHLRRALDLLVAHHDTLRLRFARSGAEWRQSHAPVDGAVTFEHHNLSDLPPPQAEGAVADLVAAAQASLDLRHGPLLRGLHFRLAPRQPDRLLLVVHHLAVDGVSRALLLEDLQTLCRQLIRGEPCRLPAKTTSYQHWAQRLWQHAQSAEVRAELPFWLGQAAGGEALPVDFPAGTPTFGSLRTVGTTLSSADTAALREVARRQQVSLSDLLVWSVLRLLADQTGCERWTIATTGHGREALFDEVDLSRTVGWFQILYPVRLHLPSAHADEQAVAAVAAQLGQVPGNGLGYALLRHSCADPRVRGQLAARPAPQIAVNYMGAFGFDDVVVAGELFSACRASAEPLQDPLGVWPFPLDVVGSLVGDHLRVDMNFSVNLYRPPTVERMLDALGRRLLRLAGRDSHNGSR